ncbi:unnamed protein product, partial [Mesorhabditis belari]|uniref:Uncharacterized protein n=1 Tax=Mesorhabditis belari TaxID=2138241 RepID=A0AAF3EDA7_9BILA
MDVIDMTDIDGEWKFWHSVHHLMLRELCTRPRDSRSKASGKKKLQLLGVLCVQLATHPCRLTVRCLNLDNNLDNNRAKSSSLLRGGHIVPSSIAVAYQQVQGSSTSLGGSTMNYGYGQDDTSDGMDLSISYNGDQIEDQYFKG